MTEFTPFESTVGGVLIGLSAGGVLLHHGRIAGLSGMLNGMHNASDKDDFLYKALYLGGLVLGSAAMTATGLGMAVNLDAVDIGKRDAFSACSDCFFFLKFLLVSQQQQRLVLLFVVRERKLLM